MNGKLTVGLAAHVDAGKTTLSEAMLFLSGAVRRQGRVDHGDAFLDTDRIEKERGITIFSKEARLTWNKTDITLVDTPGHTDFAGETELSNFTFTFHFHALEKEMATYSSVLAWRIPGMGEPGGLPSTGSHTVGHD